MNKEQGRIECLDEQSHVDQPPSNWNLMPRKGRKRKTRQKRNNNAPAASLRPASPQNAAKQIVTQSAFWCNTKELNTQQQCRTCAKLRNTSQGKNFSFGHCPNRGGEGLAQICWPFFHHVTVPYILTSISCYVYTFWSFLTPKSSKVTKL